MIDPTGLNEQQTTVERRATSSMNWNQAVQLTKDYFSSASNDNQSQVLNGMSLIDRVGFVFTGVSAVESYNQAEYAGVVRQVFNEIVDNKDFANGSASIQIVDNYTTTTTIRDDSIEPRVETIEAHSYQFSLIDDSGNILKDLGSTSSGADVPSITENSNLENDVWISTTNIGGEEGTQVTRNPEVEQ